MASTEAPATRRKSALQTMSTTAFDVVVIGGGITGASIARDAVLRGLKVALIEKHDFGAGTSSKSTKLVHGGLRYLEQAELGLVFESVNERRKLMSLARHLVRPLPFMVASYRGDRRWLATVDAGLWLYEALCFFKVYRVHRTYFAKRARALEPGLKADGLRGAIVYYDAMTDDARLTLENVMDARAKGAVVANHLRAGRLLRENEKVIGVEVTDEESDNVLEVRGKIVICATGPWSDEVRALLGHPPMLKPTKGVHFVVDSKRLPLNHAMLLSSPADKRLVFAIPWGWGRTVVGTTDTFFDGNPDHVTPDANDIEYLLATANNTFPEARLTADDVLATWSGLRPLLKPAEAGARASQVSREHVVLRQPGFITVAGGKLTTYRRMAIEVVDAACEVLGVDVKSTTADLPLPGSVGLEDSDEQVEQLRARLEKLTTPERAQLFTETYGVRSEQVLARLEVAGGDEAIDAELPMVMAQVDEAVENELATTVTDVLARRLPLIVRGRDQGLGIAERVAGRMAGLLGWSSERLALELKTYRREVAGTRAFRTAPIR